MQCLIAWCGCAKRKFSRYSSAPLTRNSNFSFQQPRIYFVITFSMTSSQQSACEAEAGQAIAGFSLSQRYVQSSLFVFVVPVVSSVSSLFSLQFSWFVSESSVYCSRSVVCFSSLVSVGYVFACVSSHFSLSFFFVILSRPL